MYRPPEGKHIFRVRVVGGDPDFIEIEMNRDTLSYRTLMERFCLELKINGAQVDRIRKLPHTRLRSDEDVRRLNPMESFEVVLKTKLLHK